jgi:hypothetical protein
VNSPGWVGPDAELGLGVDGVGWENIGKPSKPDAAGGPTGGRTAFGSLAGASTERSELEKGVSPSRPKIAVKLESLGGGALGAAPLGVRAAGGGAMGVAATRFAFIGAMMMVGVLTSSSREDAGDVMEGAASGFDRAGDSTLPNMPVKPPAVFAGASTGSGARVSGAGVRTDSSQVAKSTKDVMKSVTATGAPSTSAISRSLLRAGGRRAFS